MKVELELIKQNFNKVVLKNLILYFSYKTIIAFNYNGLITISKNVWSKTTGRHLNYVNDDKSIRVDNTKFNELLNSVLERL